MSHVFESKPINCNHNTTKVLVDSQNHGGIVELAIVTENYMDSGETLHLGVEIDQTQIDYLIESLQKAKEFAVKEELKEYGSIRTGE